MVSPFVTPDNEQSFSSIVDDVIVTTGRAAAIRSIISAANLTVRECQTFGLFARDLLEETFVGDVVPFIWTRPNYFRSVRTAKYMTSCEFPKLLLPGKYQDGQSYYYYAADDYYAFVGLQVGETLAMANYYWQKALIYYSRLSQVTTTWAGGPYATRPAYFDQAVEQWMYLNGTNNGYVSILGDPVEEALRRKNTTNWIITDWRDMVLSGTKAKIFKSFGDDRQVAEYSFYKQTQKLFAQTVGVEGEGF